MRKKSEDAIHDLVHEKLYRLFLTAEAIEPSDAALDDGLEICTPNLLNVFLFMILIDVSRAVLAPPFHHDCCFSSSTHEDSKVR